MIHPNGMADMLRFLGGAVTKHEVWWTGPWPPPERMGVSRGLQSGIVKVFEPSETKPDVLADLEACPTILVTVYRLRNASTLPDGLKTKHVFRGAEYVPE